MSATKRVKESESDRVFRRSNAKVRAKHMALAKGANWAGEFTRLEEALDAINGVAEILMEFGAAQPSNGLPLTIPAYLGKQLWTHFDSADDAFRKLHALHSIEKAKGGAA